MNTTTEDEMPQLKDALTTLEVQFARALQTTMHLADRVSALEDEVEQLRAKLRAATRY